MDVEEGGQMLLEQKEELIAPCGMNCSLCVSYQFYRGDLNREGFQKTYCPGCIPRGKNCTHMGHKCRLVGEGQVRFCFSCGKYPCKALKQLDKRYRDRYHMSMIDNLNLIRDEGIETFLQNQKALWICPHCGELRCTHNGLCLFCELETLKKNKKYCWDKEKRAEKKMHNENLKVENEND